VRKRLATTQICQTYYAQKHNVLPRLLVGDPHTLTFFNPDGSPRVWYNRDGAGTYRLFDAPGVDPNTGAKLLPVTPAVRDELVKVQEQTIQDDHKSRPPAKVRRKKRAAEPEADVSPEPETEMPPPPPSRWQYGCRRLPSGEIVCRGDH
jgi:hypothetical protein